MAGRAQLSEVVTAPPAWGRGLSSLLLHHAVADLPDVGYDAIELWTQTDNHRARRLYERLGWSRHELPAGRGQQRVADDPVPAPAGTPVSRIPAMLAWMDLEMTGLDHTSDVIVEIATLITDDDLTVVAEGPDLVVHQPPEVLARMGDFVREMHTRSGLLPADRGVDRLARRRRRPDPRLPQEHIPEARTVPLCGNSIGTDRRFLAAYLPEIEEFLHYRSVDVSTLKELIKRWNPAILGGAPPKKETHRALDDIRRERRRAAVLQGPLRGPPHLSHAASLVSGSPGG